MSAPFLMEDVIHGMSREFDADIGLQIIDSTPGAAAVSPVAIAGDAGAAAGMQLFSNLKAPALGAGGQPLQARRELELGGRRWTLQMAPQPGFVQRFQDDGHHPVALLGTVLSLILAWFTWLLATGYWARACRGPGTGHDSRAARHPRRPRKYAQRHS